ncbi:MAG: hypothetical protein ACYCV7_14565, partial [Acidimicrobiales bacterium]
MSDVAWERGIFRNFSLQAVTYSDVRTLFGLGAQAAQHTINKMVDAYSSGKLPASPLPRPTAAPPASGRVLLDRLGAWIHVTSAPSPSPPSASAAW